MKSLTQFFSRHSTQNTAKLSPASLGCLAGGLGLFGLDRWLLATILDQTVNTHLNNAHYTKEAELYFYQNGH